MSEGGDAANAPGVAENNAPSVAAAHEAGPITDVKSALKAALRSANFADGLAKGLHEAAKALDKREAYFCVLAENCEEPMYVKLVEALCKEHSIPIVKISDKKTLGEWCGLCKYDQEGKARKVVACSCAVVRNYGLDETAKNWLQNHFDKKQNQ